MADGAFGGRAFATPRFSEPGRGGSYMKGRSVTNASQRVATRDVMK